MSKWISLKELSEHYGIKEIDVIDRLVKGLQPCKKTGKPMPCLRHYHQGNILEHEISNIETDLYVLQDSKDSKRRQKLLSGSNIAKEGKIDELTEKKKQIEKQLLIIDKDDTQHQSWKYFQLPKSDTSIEKIFSDLQASLFMKSDIIQHFPEIDRDALLSESHIDRISTRKKLAARNERIKISFYKSGDYWVIGKKGKELHFKSLKGLEYIHFLIRNSNKNLSAPEVYFLGDVPPGLQEQMKVPPQKFGKLSVDTYKKAIQKLKEQVLIENDLEKRIEIEDQIEKLDSYQKEGKYNFAPEYDKYRINVYNSIKKAVELINKEFKEQGDNDLIKVFDVGRMKVIRSGIEFCYREELIGFDVRWQLAT